MVFFIDLWKENLKAYPLTVLGTVFLFVIFDCSLFVLFGNKLMESWIFFYFRWHNKCWVMKEYLYNMKLKYVLLSGLLFFLVWFNLLYIMFNVEHEKHDYIVTGDKSYNIVDDIPEDEEEMYQAGMENRLTELDGNLHLLFSFLLIQTNHCIINLQKKCVKNRPSYYSRFRTSLQKRFFFFYFEFQPKKQLKANIWPTIDAVWISQQQKRIECHSISAHFSGVESVWYRFLSRLCVALFSVFATYQK